VTERDEAKILREKLEREGKVKVNHVRSGTWAVLGIRLEALENAIRGRSWSAVEWHYDRVLRAFEKHERTNQDTPEVGQ
jgi:hypothetical protein